MSSVVLVVDDEEGVRYALGRLLSTMGHRAISVASGEEALETMETQSFDLLITDLKLPGIDGTQVLRSFKSRFPKAGTIALTGIPSYESATAVAELGVDAYLGKPFDREAMGKVINRTLRREEKQNEAPKKVLLVEDDLAFLNFLKTACRLQGLEAMGVASAEEAWTLLASGRPIDIVLTDIMLPGFSGIELCSRIKSDAGLKRIPVIMMTGSKDAIEAEMKMSPEQAAQKAGADFFLAKPADPFEIIAHLERFL